MRRRKGRVRRQIECVGTYHICRHTPNTSADLRTLGFMKIDIVLGRVSWQGCICEFPNKIDHQVRHVGSDT